jgi:hypothetical protein
LHHAVVVHRLSGEKTDARADWVYPVDPSIAARRVLAHGRPLASMSAQSRVLLSARVVLVGRVIADEVHEGEGVVGAATARAKCSRQPADATAVTERTARLLALVR